MSTSTYNNNKYIYEIGIIVVNVRRVYISHLLWAALPLVFVGCRASAMLPVLILVSFFRFCVDLFSFFCSLSLSFFLCVCNLYVCMPFIYLFCRMRLIKYRRTISLKRDNATNCSISVPALPTLTNNNDDSRNIKIQHHYREICLYKFGCVLDMYGNKIFFQKSKSDEKRTYDPISPLQM